MPAVNLAGCLLIIFRMPMIWPESLDIGRRHMAALTWDAMFRSSRAAILADGGGVLFDSVPHGVQQKWVVLCRF